MYWITGFLGLALGIAPFVLGYSDNTSAMWTSVALGAIVLLVSAYGAFVDDSKASWEYWVAGIVGLLAVIAPFVLGFSTLTIALWTTIVLGAVMAILAGYELFYHLPRQHQA